MASSRIACGFAGLALLTLGEAIGVAADLGPPFPVESLPTSIDVKCQERFLNEAPPAWKTLGVRLQGIELEHTYVDYGPTDTKEPFRDVYSSTYCILKDGVSRRLERDQVIDVMNSRYVAKNAVVRIQENRFGPPRACSRPMEEFFLPHYGLSDDPLPSIPDQCGPPSSSP